jgi:hypothetical protein
MPIAQANTVHLGLDFSSATQQMKAGLGNLQQVINSMPEGTDKENFKSQFNSLKDAGTISKGDSPQVIRAKVLQQVNFVKSLIKQVEDFKKTKNIPITNVDIEAKKNIDNVQMDLTTDTTATQEKEAPINVSPQQVESATEGATTQEQIENKEAEQEKTEVEQKSDKKAKIDQPTAAPQKQAGKGLLNSKVLKAILGAGLLGGGVLGQYLLNKKNVEDQKKNIADAEEAIKRLMSNPNADPKQVENAQRKKEEEVRNLLMQQGLQQFQEHARKEKERKHDIGANLGNLGGLFGGRPHAESEIPRDIYRRATGVGHKLGNLW